MRTLPARRHVPTATAIRSCNLRGRDGARSGQVDAHDYQRGDT